MKCMMKSDWLYFFQHNGWNYGELKDTLMAYTGESVFLYQRYVEEIYCLTGGLLI